MPWWGWPLLFWAGGDWRLVRRAGFAGWDGLDSLYGCVLQGLIRGLCSGGRLTVWETGDFGENGCSYLGRGFPQELSTGVAGRVRRWHSGGHAGMVAGPDRSGAAGRVRRLWEASHGALSGVPCRPGRGRTEPGATGAGAARTAGRARGGSVCGLGTGGVAGPQGAGRAGPRWAARYGSGGGGAGGGAGGMWTGGWGICAGVVSRGLGGGLRGFGRARWRGGGCVFCSGDGGSRRGPGWRCGCVRGPPVERGWARCAGAARSRAVRAVGGSGSGT
ncbi:hypothetical protein SCANM124S_05990 [Streptomyces canus]